MSDFLRDDFSDTARWRREKAVEYPDDRRNFEAAELLERLANWASAVPAGMLTDLELYSETDGFRFSEVWSESLRAVGFRAMPDTAEEFVEDVLHELRREIA